MITRDALLKNKPLIIAGPCALEDEQQALHIADELHNMHVSIMRCALWKPRTNPNSFQGVGEKGLEWIQQIRGKVGMMIATEILDSSQLEKTKGLVDLPWVGSRNMQNFALLKEMKKDERPILLKRGMCSTIDEWMGAADHMGRDKVILCERGIRTGADSMRFTMDINSSLVAQHDKHMPVIVDPSHPAGRRDMVIPLSRAAIASGADGLLIEVHPDPDQALSDSKQQLTIPMFRELLREVLKIHVIVS